MTTRFGPLVAACLAWALISRPGALGQPASPPAPHVEALSTGALRFFASPAARAEALPSYAILQDVEREPKAKAELGPRTPRPAFESANSKHVVRVPIEPGTSLYGTGEAAGPLLRNGRRVVAWNTDAYGYADEAPSLYKSHPWVLAVRADGSAFGLLADTTYRCEIDTAAATPNEVAFTADGPSYPLIVIEADHPAEVVKHLGRLTGLMPLPPKWSLGYHQCRYSYYPESRVREVAREFRARSIPCDVIWFDIDYMEAFRVFTFDRAYFPDPKTLNEDLLARGFHNVWMIDPGMKSRPGRGASDRTEEDMAKDPAPAREARAAEVARYNAILESGTREKAWVLREDGAPYEGEVWPGWCHFPDYTSPRVREWWANLYAPFMANSIHGVWNDMNEPAVFNVESKTMPLSNRHAGDPALLTPAGTPQGDRAKGDHARYHNVYGLSMIKGTLDGISRANPSKRPFVLSRATFIGGQRYHAGWSGDNSADWYHLEASIPMVLNMGLSGFSFYGPDIGGFAGNGDGALFARWMGFGALLPFARGHTGKGNIDKEPWAFGEQVERTCRNALEARSMLMPYLYTAFHEASTTGMPVARPLFFADPKDPALRSEDDAFLLGGDLLVVANVLPDRSRLPALPKSGWTAWSARSDPDLPSILIREGAIVPTGPVCQYVDQKPLDPLTLNVALDAGGRAQGVLYEDAGDGVGYAKGEFLLTTYLATRDGDAVTVRVADSKGGFPRPSRKVKVQIVLPATGAGAPGMVESAAASGADGQPIVVRLPSR